MCVLAAEEWSKQKYFTALHFISILLLYDNG
jgi:hypothetical protein